VKRASTILLLGLMLGLLLPTFVVATDNIMVMKGPGGGGGGGGQVTPPMEIEYFTDSGQDKWAVLIGISVLYRLGSGQVGGLNRYK